MSGIREGMNMGAGFFIGWFLMKFFGVILLIGFVIYAISAANEKKEEEAQQKESQVKAVQAAMENRAPLIKARKARRTCKIYMSEKDALKGRESFGVVQKGTSIKVLSEEGKRIKYIEEEGSVTGYVNCKI